jgi:hypothetical protein
MLLPATVGMPFAEGSAPDVLVGRLVALVAWMDMSVAALVAHTTVNAEVGEECLTK